MRGLVRTILGGVLFLGLGIGAVALIPAERVAGLAAAEFQRMTGRVLTIGGSARASIWPVPGVTVEDVALANAAWSAEGPMLAADRLSMGLDLSALVRGEVRITGIEADGLRLVLERSAEGVANWDFAAGQAGAEPVAGGATATPFGLERIAVTGASVLWIDHARAVRTTVGDIALDLRAPDPAGPVTLVAEAVLAGQPVTLTATAGDATAALAGRVVPLTAEVTVGGSVAGFDGRAGLTPAVAEGRMTADLSDLDAVAALIGWMPDLPQGLGAGVRQVEGQVTLAPGGSLHLRDGVLTLDENRATVAADVTFDGPRPKVTAQIDTGTLQVAGMDAPSGDAVRPQDAAWSRDPIDVSWLGWADAAVAFRADGLTLGSVTLGPTRAMATVERARAAVDLRGIEAWGGRIGGSFVVNGRGGLSVGGDLRLAGIALQPMLDQIAGEDRLSGMGDAEVKFLGVGGSVAAIMATLSGAGSVTLARGELRGLDLPEMLRSPDPGVAGVGRATVFDRVAATFTLRDGVLRNDDLALSAPRLTAAGAGTVGLGAQVIDYRLTPTVPSDPEAPGGVAVPLQITGPWSAPRFDLDLRALADRQLAEERARIEEAEAEARRRAEEVLRDGAAEAVQGVLTED